MSLIDEKGYSKLQKNNTPTKLTVTVTLIAMEMATAMMTAIALNGNGVLLEIVPILFTPIRRMFHLSLFSDVIVTKKSPNERPVLNPKGHPKLLFEWIGMLIPPSSLPAPKM
jgi:hypothetical protein